MAFTPSFYHGKTPSETFGERVKSLFGLFILICVVSFLIYAIYNFSKTGQFLGFDSYKQVKLVSLLSYANFYSGKKVCTRGYYVQTETLSIIKVSLNEDEFTRSAWIYDPSGREIITRIPGKGGAVIVTICGYFESSRAKEFGNPSVWNHQLTVDNFETHGDFIEIDQSFLNKTF